MKILIALILLSVGGSAGWMLRSNLPEGVVPVVAQNHGNMTARPVSKPTQVVGTPLDANTGNTLLFERAFISHIWIRSKKPDGQFGSKHLFLKATEQPPLSGSYKLARYAYYNRPDLQGRLPLLIEPVMRGQISTIIQIGGMDQPIMRIWLQEPERIIDVPEEEFPATLEEAWRIAHERLRSANLRTV